MKKVNAYWDWDFTEHACLRPSHFDFRRKIRSFVETHMTPFVDEWEEKKEYPVSLNTIAGEQGIIGAIYPKEVGGSRPDDFDYFHDWIFWDELCRCGSNGTLVGVFFTTAIAMPPLLKHGLNFSPGHGPDAKTKEICRSIISGHSVIALAVTEPSGGSDVAALKTTAKKSACGKFYIVNGEKTLITAGIRANYLTTAVRTGGEGLSGISFLLIPSDLPGVKRRRLSTMGWDTSFTTAISYEDVRVPVEYLIGNENEGFYYVMENFNFERWRGVCMGVRGIREVLEDSINYAFQRSTFGKPLVKILY